MLENYNANDGTRMQRKIIFFNQWGISILIIPMCFDIFGADRDIWQWKCFYATYRIERITFTQTIARCRRTALCFKIVWQIFKRTHLTTSCYFSLKYCLFALTSKKLHRSLLRRILQKFVCCRSVPHYNFHSRAL